MTAGGELGVSLSSDAVEMGAMAAGVAVTNHTDRDSEDPNMVLKWGSVGGGGIGSGGGSGSSPDTSVAHGGAGNNANDSDHDRSSKISPHVFLLGKMLGANK
jgi:hypothetical protein